MVSPARRISCPICRRPFDPEGEAAVMPFCSRRCQEVDLGRWLDESYGLPVEGDEEAEPEGDDEQA